jgi:hypothetical protein
MARAVIAQFYIVGVDDVTLTPKREGVWFVDLKQAGRVAPLVVKCGTKRRPFVFGTFAEVA